MSSAKPRETMPRTAADPNVERMAQMIKGYWISQIVGTLARLGIPDHLAGGSLGVDDLAGLTACHPEATYRLMRAAAAAGVVLATAGGRFGLTPLGRTLRSDVPGSIRDTAIALTAPGHWLPWGRLSEAVRDGRRQTQETLGAELFHYYSENPDEGRAFTGAMSASSAEVADEIAQVLDTSSARHVVDVGGASGTLITALLVRNPLLEGTILDRPDVVDRATAAVAERGLASRCHVIAGDFFVTVPEADIHILKSIIHDWDDEQSILLLSHCARSLRPNGRVVLVERVIPDGNATSDAALADLNMLVVTPGRERTLHEYRDMLARAGLALDRIVATTSSFSVMEASAA
jgi:SAM-dependent methyltransferase